VFRAPVVFVVQNNGYAISVPFAEQTAATALADRGPGYGIPAVRVDGNDCLAVMGAVDAGAERARLGAGPTLVEAVTYRVGPHTNADDPNRYRSATEAARWLERDPVASLQACLRAAGHLGDALDARIAAEACAAVEEARAAVSAHPAVCVDDLFAHVYGEMTTHLREQRDALLEERRHG
jgi:pyruvate dehydrogenase E1 component alpha subunit